MGLVSGTSYKRVRVLAVLSFIGGTVVGSRSCGAAAVGSFQERVWLLLDDAELIQRECGYLGVVVGSRWAVSQLEREKGTMQ